MELKDEYQTVELIIYDSSKENFKRGTIGEKLQQLIKEGKIEIIPSTFHEYAQSGGSKALFRHFQSALYLEYYFNGDRESVDILMPANRRLKEFNIKVCRDGLEEVLGEFYVKQED